jgi:hypothetical protein
MNIVTAKGSLCPATAWKCTTHRNNNNNNNNNNDNNKKSMV